MLFKVEFTTTDTVNSCVMIVSAPNAYVARKTMIECMKTNRYCADDEDRNNNIRRIRQFIKHSTIQGPGYYSNSPPTKIYKNMNQFLRTCYLTPCREKTLLIVRDSPVSEVSTN